MQEREASPEPTSGSLPLAARLSPLLLAGLACLQIALAFQVGLSPWKGGGFGMFSTNDHGAFRAVRVVALEPGGERVLHVPSEWVRLRRRAREWPTRRALGALAEVLFRAAPRARALRVEVWRTVFDAESLQPHRRLLVARRFEAPS